MLYGCIGETNDALPNAECELISKSNLTDLGELHNSIITNIYSQIDIAKCGDCEAEMSPMFLKMCDELGNGELKCQELLTFSLKSSKTLNEINYDFGLWKNHSFSEECFRYLSLIQDNIKLSESHDDFVNRLNLLEETIIEDHSVSCFDVNLLQGTIQIAKHSAYLWMPIDMGGLALNYVEHDGLTLRNGWSGDGAIAGDVAGSASYFTGLGTGLAVGLFVPGTNAAILGGWGFAAAGASLWGGVNTQPCP